ncbi:MAG: hypothetical protein KBD00_04465 [Candidatus Peribacteraceae bacterium]|nr:hypothetical protein [Candidatus Peribacteraceae bacterium]
MPSSFHGEVRIDLSVNQEGSMNPAEKRRALDGLIKLMRDRDVRAILMTFRQDKGPKSEQEILTALPPNGMTAKQLSLLLEKMMKYLLVIHLPADNGKWAQGDTAGFMEVIDPKGLI